MASPTFDADKPMRRLMAYLKSYRTTLSMASVNSVLNKILDLMPPLLVGWIIDNLTGNQPGFMTSLFGVSDVWGGAIFLSLSIIVIFGAEGFFEWRYALGFKNLAQRVQHDLRLDAYDHLQHREIAFFERNSIGNLMAMLNDDINQLERFLNQGFNQIIQLIVLFLFAGTTLMLYSWELALMGIAAIPVIIAGSFWYQRIIAPRYAKIRGSVGDLASRLENNLSGIMVVKSFSAEAYEYERVEKVSDTYMSANQEAIKLNTLYVPLIRMVIAFGFAACMLVGSWWVIQGTHGITPGGLTFFGMMIQRMLWPMTRMGDLFDEFERARASARRVFGLMDTPNQLQVPKQGTGHQVDRAKGGLSFRRTEFAYSPEVQVIKGLEAEVPAGHTIGVAGPSGSGKTTLIKLIMRLYDVTGGEILLDGKDLRAWNLKNLRRQIALVSQDTYLFQGTIAENICYGMGFDLDRIKEAAKQAKLDQFVESLPDGYDSIVGERGIKLSGGQRQRISIARAIYKEAPILILDEATSSVDSETERAIQEHLDDLVEGRTAIIIAHRLSTIRHADEIWVMKDGEIQERGTHDELLDESGIYSELWHVQTGDWVAS
ncbi:ABC transporter ATP-binding protein [Pontibacter sp. G13]|uniref:ABC transporter ATP-binding protein n=1 Tax=Pontibacter sp. G13 TaxID=3074898 RepID=UPI00288B5036|nr:ABC transporter ATP-binding protein [Pontibacter sp. G13]WNJ18580.1 ABC transporter ATP-binding protein [Pontibacter sp. G13]